MARFRFPDQLHQWELLNAAAKSVLGDLPSLRARQEELEVMIARARTFHQGEEALRSQLREVVHSRQALQNDGHVVARRLESMLKGELGFTTDRLIAFGIKPFKPSRRRQQDEPTPTPPPTDSLTSLALPVSPQ
jgi:hypothetical protein